MKKAPCITDNFERKYKYVVDAVSDAIFYANLTKVSIPLLLAAYSHCNTYAKKN